MEDRSVGKVLNILYDRDTKEMQITLLITDTDFKNRVLHESDLKDKITFKGEDVMWVATTKKKDATNVP